MFLSVPQTCPSPPSLIHCLTPTSRFEFASRQPFGETPPLIGQKSPRKRVLKSAYTRSPRKVNCYQSGDSRFWPSCDISATKLEPSWQISGDITVAES